ncbi:hypothetical protein CR513_60508, partial [Mucuna pruriens]
MEENRNRMVSLNDTNCFLWKKGKSKEKDHDDDHVTTIIGDFIVLKMGNDGVTKVIGVGDVYL